jgi:hypothetical protein
MAHFSFCFEIDFNWRAEMRSLQPLRGPQRRRYGASAVPYVHNSVHVRAKLAAGYLAFIRLASIRIGLRIDESTPEGIKKQRA